MMISSSSGDDNDDEDDDSFDDDASLGGAALCAGRWCMQGSCSSHIFLNMTLELGSVNYMGNALASCEVGGLLWSEGERYQLGLMSHPCAGVCRPYVDMCCACASRQPVGLLGIPTHFV